MEQEISQEDKIDFGGNVYKVKDIVVKDFRNKIWRSGFVYGVMTGGALILLIIAVIVSIVKL